MELSKLVRALNVVGVDPDIKLKCTSCKGVGKQILTVITHAIELRGSGKEVAEITCIDCSGTGQITLQKAIGLRAQAESWCKCSSKKQGYYWQRDEHRGCIKAEHIHCVDCGKFYQVG